MKGNEYRKIKGTVVTVFQKPKGSYAWVYEGQFSSQEFQDEDDAKRDFANKFIW